MIYLQDFFPSSFKSLSWSNMRQQEEKASSDHFVLLWIASFPLLPLHPSLLSAAKQKGGSHMDTNPILMMLAPSVGLSQRHLCLLQQWASTLKIDSGKQLDCLNCETPTNTSNWLIAAPKFNAPYCTLSCLLWLKLSSVLTLFCCTPRKQHLEVTPAGLIWH